MSDKNKGISPFKDPAFLKGSANKRKTEISDKDINEFKEAFSDGDDVKTYTPKKEASDPPKEKPAAQEALYEIPSVDIDAFFEKLTGIPSSKEKTGISSSAKEPSSAEKTRILSLGGLKKAPSSKAPVNEHKNIRKNVRVLVKSKQSDKHILDIAPPEEEKTNIIDVLGTKKGEDIFEAVDRVLAKDGTGAAYAAAMESVSKRDKQERDKKAIVSGKKLRDKLIKQNNTRKLKLIFCVVLFIISLLLPLSAAVYTEGGALSFLFSDGARVYGIVKILILLLLTAIFSPPV